MPDMMTSLLNWGHRMGTDRDWERWGGSDPYFGVCSDKDFHADSMTAESRVEFFASGEAHGSRVLRDIERTAGTGFAPASVLDFGCGVSRLVIPFAQRARRVVGVDVFPSMIAKEKRNCGAAQVSGVEFVESDDGLNRIHGAFGLVHSYIVLQHIPWKRGRCILRALADHVAPGGWLAVQILSRYEASSVVRWMVRLRYALPPVNWLRNLLRRRPLFEPAMQLHVYDLAAVKSDLKQDGFVCSQVDEPFAEFCSTLLYARREA